MKILQFPPYRKKSEKINTFNFYKNSFTATTPIKSFFTILALQYTSKSQAAPDRQPMGALYVAAFI